MSTSAPKFWSTPLRYCRWAARERPGLFYSVIIGSAGPVLLVVAPPIKRARGWEPRPHIPQTYPVPTGPRKIPEGYDDP